MGRKKNVKFNMKSVTAAAESLAKDFEQFLDYLGKNPVKLSARPMRLGKKDCFEINKRLRCAPEIWKQAGRNQEGYVEIDYLFYFSLQYRVLRQIKSGSSFTLQITDKAEKFLSLSNAERYGIMLVYMLDEYWNGEDDYNRTNTFDLLLRFEYRKQLTSGTDIDLKERTVIFMQFPRMFAIFGLMEIQWKESLEKNDRNGINGIRLTDLGEDVLQRLDPISFIKVHDTERETYCYRKFSDIVDSQAEAVKDFLKPVEVVGDFTYILRVTVGQCIRKIRIGGQEDLETLHDMIQEAIHFDDDHLYYFSIGNGRMRKRYFRPECNYENFYADEFLLREVLPYEKMTFTYLFDFGDRWEFNIVVEKILPEYTQQPQVIERKGEDPDQYGEFDFWY